MLVPVLVRANYKISTSLSVTLENIVGANVPLLFPEVYVHNRSPDPVSVSVTGLRDSTYLNQSDPDFNGIVSQSLFSALSLGQGQSVKLPGLDYSLVPSAFGVTTSLTLSNAGPAAEAWVSLVVKGMIESSVSPDPLVVVNAT
jgi:hypothetical protein